MKHTFAALCAAAMILTACAAAQAASTAIWTQYGAPTFFQGDMDNLSLTSDGLLELGLEHQSLMTTTEPYIWSLTRDSKGLLYAGSGNKSVLYKILGNGKREELAMLPGIGITALASDKNNIYAGVFPTGEVFKLDRWGNRKLLANLPARYVWALKPDGKGNILAATGAPGGIHRIGPKGEVTTLLRSPERHILCFDTDENGIIYAGSSPAGLIFRVDPKTEKHTVLYDLKEEEAYRIIYLGDGEMLIAANNNQNPAAAAAAAAAAAKNNPGGSPPPPQQKMRDEPLSFPIPYTPVMGQALPVPSAIYRLKTDGDIQKIFTLPDPFILTMFRLDKDNFLIGTGNRGNVYSLNIESQEGELHTLPVQQVLNIYGDEKTQFFATGNPGAIYTFKSVHNATGTYTAPVNDTYGLATWGHLWADIETPAGSRLEFSVRTGNTSNPDDGSWTEWSQPITDLPAQIEDPPGRFIQYRTNFFASDTLRTPALREVNIAYLTANQPPRINSLKIAPVAQRRQPPPPQSESSGAASPPTPRPAGPKNGGPSPKLNNYQVGSLTARQEITITWKVLDPDRDGLRYELYFRRMPSTNWNVLQDEYYPSEYRWPTESVPDGKYEIKLVASDAPDNPENRTRTEEKISEQFIIDNSRPTVTATAASPKNGSLTIAGTASDPTSIISGIEYSLDDLEWRIIFPTDMIFDSQDELFTFDLEGLDTGEHTVIVRARDFVGNTSSISVQFDVK